MVVWQNHKCVFIFLERLGSITQKQKLQTSKISSKAIKHPFNKSLLTFTDLSRWTLIHINRTSVQSHTSKRLFHTYHASFYTVCNKNTWLSVIRTHSLPALPALDTGMRQNAYYHKVKWHVKIRCHVIVTQYSQTVEQWFPKWAVRDCRDWGAVKQKWAVGGR